MLFLKLKNASNFCFYRLAQTEFGRKNGVINSTIPTQLGRLAADSKESG